MAVVVGLPIDVGDAAGGLAEDRRAGVAAQDVLLDLAREDLAPGYVGIEILNASRAEVCTNLLAVEQACEDGGVGQSRQRARPVYTSVGVVDTGYDGAPVE